MSSPSNVRTSRGRRFTPLRVTLFLILVAALLIWQGSERIPEIAASGTALNGPAPTSQPSGPTLRVATFNINGNSGDDTAQTMQGFDLIGMQEVHGGLPVVGSDGARVLGEKLKMQWLFAPVEKQWWRDAFGDGVLSSLPVEHWQRFPLNNDGVDSSNREVLILRMKFDGKPLNVLITHLDRGGDREAELTTVASLFNSMQSPAILMGDFNSPNDDPQIQALRSTPGVIDPIGDKVVASGNESWDRIFAKGMSSNGAGFIDKGSSDHPLAWADLKLNEGQ